MFVMIQILDPLNEVGLVSKNLQQSNIQWQIWYWYRSFRQLLIQVILSISFHYLNLYGFQSNKVHIMINNEKFVCDLCTFQTETKRYLKRHKNRKHSAKNIVFKCELCSSQYTSKKNLERHHDQKHSLNPKFVCPICKARLGGASELERHILTHDTENLFKHACPICGKTSKTLESSEHHVKYNHTRKGNFACDFCLKTLPYPYGKKDHQEKRK